MTSTIMNAPVNTPPAAPRLGWLDALRGFAALVVVLFHVSPYAIGAANHAVLGHYFDMGKFGVLLFFLVSGYVIPMSLERHGSPRRFWVGRVFRIYPAYLLSIVVFAGFVLAGMTTVPGALRRETVTGVLGHATMLQEFVGGRGLLRPFWTLSYEMTFYLVVVGLFVWGLHRLSALWAAGLLLTSVLVGTALPKNLFGSGMADHRMLALVLALLVGASLVAYLSGLRWAVLAAGLAGLCFVALPLLNGHPSKGASTNSSWQAAFMLAVMFAGTVIYRTQHGQISRWVAFPLLTAITVGVGLNTWLQVGGRFELYKWCTTAVAVAVAFGIAFAVRHRPVPHVMTWLGAVSYSLYLLHKLAVNAVVNVLPDTALDSLPGRAGTVVLILAVALGAAWLSYRYVELPGQQLGRRVQRYLDARLGPEQWRRPPASPAVPAPRAESTAPVPAAT
ncbi:acyltransferase family protein [Actinoplanes palleronii]|nr:acyltransferase [Actinoplanes palleronii]